MTKPDIIVIMEIRTDPYKLRRSFELLGCDGFVGTEVRGYAGGIVVGWNSNEVNIQVMENNFQFLHLNVKYGDDREWFFTPIYASPHEDSRRLMWDDLKRIASNISHEWLVAGDFNDIMSPMEKKGGAEASIRKCNLFRDRVDGCHLIDIGAVGSKYTWRGPIYQGGCRIYERLDRALCNDIWRLRFPEAIVKVLMRVEFADHHPLLICPYGTGTARHYNNFRFESAWLVDNAYDELVTNNWDGNVDIHSNLSNLTTTLQNWNYNFFQRVIHKKRELFNRLSGIQRKVQLGQGHRGLKSLENKLNQELSNILMQEERLWFQRSRAKWLHDGDRNTKYYHLKTINRRRKNKILMIRDEEGVWIEDEEHIRNMMRSFYMDLFKAREDLHPWDQTNLSFPRLDHNVILKLGDDITNLEVKQAVFSMSPWKAPGPDGFPAGFYQNSWDVVGPLMCDFIKKAWKDLRLLEEINLTDICLIPKVEKPEFVNQFRPISLCNNIYKVMSKVMVNRLKESMQFLISPYQTGFIPGRCIHENIVVAQEMVHSMHKMTGKVGYFAIKVDLTKAYDMLDWNFIMRILHEIKLPENFIRVIHAAVSSVKTNVKWNGNRTTFFNPQRGIRQGDPISPYLFVLCMDKLSHLIIEEVDKGGWKALKAGRNGPTISHLMFADDLLLFGQATDRQMQCVMNILNRFCNLSGQLVSIEKTSVLFSKNVDRVTRQRLLRISGFRETTQLGKYLGVPVTGKAPKRRDYQYLIDQVSTKLTSWKAKHLSFAGRITLAKAVIESIPVFPMMNAAIPKACLNEIQKIQRGFIWGDAIDKRKFHAVRWNIVTMPKEFGGLGLRDLHTIYELSLSDEIRMGAT
jgi:hypothetical protein